ncbi:MAG: hypothetical protein JSS95_11485 [Acidobacteria bacterium]|nr:hypothetical protein [Acidobacteriota bacterium]
MTVPVSLSSILRYGTLTAALLLCLTANRGSAETAPHASELATAALLPDSPGASVATATGFSSSNADAAAWPWQTNNTGPKPAALPQVKFIAAGQPAPRQKAHDKIELGLRESVTPFSMIGWAASATWSQLIDSSPNYGTNGKAFAQRLGAAAALNSSKEIFSDGVLATAFHQDPRYYQMGHGHTFIDRAIYAGTRPVIGRTDGGRTIPNFAFILGTGGAAALTHTYYPERNVTPGQVMQTWATSLGGSAFGYLLSEFGNDAINWLHIRKHE